MDLGNACDERKECKAINVNKYVRMSHTQIEYKNVDT